MYLRPTALFLNPLRLTSNDMRYVERMRLLEYWALKDSALTSEFRRSQFLVMVDRRPLVHCKGTTISLACHSYSDLQKSLGEYGFSLSTSNSCLLDAVEGPDDMITVYSHFDTLIFSNVAFHAPLFGTSLSVVEPPEDSPIRKEDVLCELGRCLDAQFIDVRIAMLGLFNERERNLLAKFQALSRWYRTFLRCPKCGAPLRMRVSKTGASCLTCPRVYYPTCSPVAITLIADPTDSYALLVRHKGSPPGVFTALAGFAQPGETLDECVRREIAEEVGLPVFNVTSLNRTQPWPMPGSSLMCAHYAVTEMSFKIDACPTELESARWFSREEVGSAVQRTFEDPFLKGIPKNVNERQQLHYIPPQGAIAHDIIKSWVERRLFTQRQGNSAKI